MSTITGKLLRIKLSDATYGEEEIPLRHLTRFISARGIGAKYLYDELAPLVDVVEAFNARIHSAGPNRRAAELARRHGKLSGAGSDAHTLREVGGAFVEVPPHPNRPGAFLEALSHARVVGTSSSHLVHLASTWAKLRKRLPGWSPGPS